MTKTIDTNYGKVEITKTTEKASVSVDRTKYTRVLWEDTAGGRWVLVRRQWYRIDNIRGRNGFEFVERGVYGF